MRAAVVAVGIRPSRRENVHAKNVVATCCKAAVGVPTVKAGAAVASRSVLCSVRKPQRSRNRCSCSASTGSGMRGNRVGYVTVEPYPRWRTSGRCGGTRSERH